MSVRDNDGVRTCAHGHAVRDFEELDVQGKPTGFMIPVAEECKLCPGGRAGIAFRKPDEEPAASGTFDAVSSDPRPGDALSFTGGRFSYEVEGFTFSEADVQQADLLVKRVEPFRDGTSRASTVLVSREVWSDLVRLSCRASRIEGVAS